MKTTTPVDSLELRVDSHGQDVEDLIQLLALSISGANQAVIDARWQLATYRDRGSELQLKSAALHHKHLKQRLALLSPDLFRKIRSKAAGMVLRDLQALRGYNRRQAAIRAEMEVA